MMGHIHRRSAGDTLALMNQAGLSMAQMVGLHVLIFRGACSVSALAACLRLSPAATSHLVDRLVQAALVERTEDAVDRRSKRLAITEKGRALVQRVQEERARELSAVMSRLSPGVRRSFAEVLERVITELGSIREEKAEQP